MISQLAYVHPSAQIGKGVTIHPFVSIEADVQVGDDCEIMSHSTLKKGTKIGCGNCIFEGAVIGSMPQDPQFKGEQTNVVIGDRNIIRESVIISRGLTAESPTLIGNNNHILAGSRISHSVKMGNRCAVGKSVVVAGHCILHDHAIISSGVLMNMYCRVGSYSLTMGGSIIFKDVPPFVRVGGHPAVYEGINTTVLQKNNFSEVNINNIAKAYRVVYNSQISLYDAVQQIKMQVDMNEYTTYLVEFLAEASRGVAGKQSPCD